MYPSPLAQETSQDTGFLGKLDDDPALREYNYKILNTIEILTASGKSKNTLRSVQYSLRQLNRETDLMNPEAVAPPRTFQTTTTPKTALLQRSLFPFLY